MGSLFWIRLSLSLTRIVNICIMLWNMMLGISLLLCTCQCLSAHLQPSLSCYLSFWHLSPSFHSLYSYSPSLSIHTYLFFSLPLLLSLSPVVVIKRALCVSLQCCVIRVESEHERETVCVVGFSETRGTCCPLLAGNTKGTIPQLLPLCLQPLTTLI